MISGLITEKIEGHNSDLHQLDVGLEVWKFFKVWRSGSFLNVGINLRLLFLFTID